MEHVKSTHGAHGTCSCNVDDLLLIEMRRRRDRTRVPVVVVVDEARLRVADVLRRDVRRCRYVLAGGKIHIFTGSACERGNERRSCSFAAVVRWRVNDQTARKTLKQRAETHICCQKSVCDESIVGVRICVFFCCWCIAYVLLCSWFRLLNYN